MRNGCVQGDSEFCGTLRVQADAGLWTVWSGRFLVGGVDFWWKCEKNGVGWLLFGKYFVPLHNYTIF